MLRNTIKLYQGYSEVDRMITKMQRDIANILAIFTGMGAIPLFDMFT